MVTEHCTANMLVGSQQPEASGSDKKQKIKLSKTKPQTCAIICCQVRAQCPYVALLEVSPGS